MSMGDHTIGRQPIGEHTMDEHRGPYNRPATHTMDEHIWQHTMDKAKADHTMDENI